MESSKKRSIEKLLIRSNAFEIFFILFVNSCLQRDYQQQIGLSKFVIANLKAIFVVAIKDLITFIFPFYEKIFIRQSDDGGIYFVVGSSMSSRKYAVYRRLRQLAFTVYYG
jgi:hypothetical protein